MMTSFTRKIIQTYIFEDHKDDEIRINTLLASDIETLQKHLRIKNEDLPVSREFTKRYENYEDETTKARHNRHLFKSKLSMHTQNTKLITDAEQITKEFYEESIIIRHLIKIIDVEEFTDLLIKNFHQMRKNRGLVKKFEKQVRT